MTDNQESLPTEHIINLVRAIEELSEGYAGEYGGRANPVEWALQDDSDTLASYALVKAWLALQPIHNHKEHRA